MRPPRRRRWRRRPRAIPAGCERRLKGAKWPIPISLFPALLTSNGGAANPFLVPYPARRSSPLRALRAGDFAETGKTRLAVGPEIACLPPVLDRGEQLADHRTGRDAKSRDIEIGRASCRERV